MADFINASARTISVSVTSTASSPTQLPERGNTLRVANEGPSTVYIAVGGAGVAATVPGTSFATATTTSTPVLAGEDTAFTVNWTGGETHLSAICASGQTARLFVQAGEGV